MNNKPAGAFPYNAVMRARKPQQNGVTLVELIFTIAIMAIILAMAIPNLRTMIVSSRLTSQTNTLIGALSMARSEAIKRNNLVIMARTGANWQDGWNIFVDLDADNAFDVNNEPEIQRYEAISSGFSIRPTGVFTNRAVYRPDGRITANGHFDTCSPAGDTDFRRVIIADTGRISVATPESLVDESYETACP